MEAASNFCTDRQEGIPCCFEPVVNSSNNVSMHGVFFYYFVIDRSHKKYLYMNNNNSIILFYMNNISLHKSCFCVMLQNSLLLLFLFIQLCASSVQSSLLSAGFFVFFSPLNAVIHNWRLLYRVDQISEECSSDEKLLVDVLVRLSVGREKEV